ncbi:MAG: SurA N-terminal domain-containing protein [Elusimicrobia bacterium]|nr:SurA N-terminal domain-containing protein [Elusimicrobiota bacterium]
MISFLRKHRKSIFVATISVFLSGTFVGLGGFYFTSRDTDGAVARIGASKIPAQRLLIRVNQYAEALREKGTDVDDAMMSRLKREMLNDMMIEEMMALKADELGLKVTNDELSRDIRATPAFQREGRFDQELYFRQVRAIFRENPQEYERSRRKAIKSGRLKQLIYRMAKLSPAEVDAAYAQVLKTAPKKEAAKITKAAVAQNLQQQRAVELINHCLKQLSARVEHQIWMERVDGGA